MNKKLNCIQINSILDFYIDGTLNKLLYKLVKEHIDSCPKCMTEYLTRIEKNLTIYNDNEKSNDEVQIYDKQYSEFKENLSAYVDNELDDFDNIKIKKYTISNPYARKDLENIYAFKKILHTSYEKTKNELKSDFSKTIANKIEQELKHGAIADPFYKIILIFFILISFLIASIITLLYFHGA